MKPIGAILLLELALWGQPGSAVAGDDPCASLLGTCEYYACIDDVRLPCGGDGYALGYGQAYCEKFTQLAFWPPLNPWQGWIFPADGDRWRDGVRLCLQEQLQGYFAQGGRRDCRSLREFAFASHPRCYTGGEDSFCALTPQNVAQVGLTIAPTDFFAIETQQRVRQTASLCVDQLDGRIQREDNPWVRFELGNARNLWQLIARDPQELFRFAARNLPVE